MYDYMRALREKFDTPPGCRALQDELETAHNNLHRRLNRDEQKLLLQITDLQNAIRDEASLRSFFAGFRLATGIHRELAQEPPYSFDRDEERRAEGTYIEEQERSYHG